MAQEDVLVEDGSPEEETGSPEPELEAAILEGESDTSEETSVEEAINETEDEADDSADLLEEAEPEAEGPPDLPEDAEPEDEAAGEGLVPPEEIPEGAAWYVVHTYSGYENKVKRNLEYRVESTGRQDRVFRVVVPVEEEVDIKEGQRRVVERRVFPGYVFVQMSMDEDAWYLVHNTPGVTSFVGSGSKPTPLRDDEVERILKRIEAEEPTVRVSFREGQRVQIVDGPFSDFHGIVDEIDMERGKVHLLVSFFGRETPVELDLLQVEKG
ncbi:MAG: Transcription termination/antitermination protein NusG [Anaerolineales bacterium]|nr:Transcription termination/antitermination protein NusG [Anaerolineales bacterium]